MPPPGLDENKFRDPQQGNVQRERDRQTLEYLFLNGMSLPKPSPQGTQNPAEEEVERLLEPGGWRKPRKQDLLHRAGRMSQGDCGSMPSVCTDRVSAPRGGVDTVSILNTEAMSN